jgi:hypothetical protein
LCVCGAHGTRKLLGDSSLHDHHQLDVLLPVVWCGLSTSFSYSTGTYLERRMCYSRPVSLQIARVARGELPRVWGRGARGVAPPLALPSRGGGQARGGTATGDGGPTRFNAPARDVRAAVARQSADGEDANMDMGDGVYRGSSGHGAWEESGLEPP